MTNDTKPPAPLPGMSEERLAVFREYVGNGGNLTNGAARMLLAEVDRLRAALAERDAMDAERKHRQPIWDKLTEIAEGAVALDAHIKATARPAEPVQAGPTREALAVALGASTNVRIPVQAGHAGEAGLIEALEKIAEWRPSHGRNVAATAPFVIAKRALAAYRARAGEGPSDV